MTPTIFDPAGPSHLALMYARMRRTNPFSHEDLFKCFPNKFKQPYMATRSLKRLETQGFVANIPQGWVITDKGTQYLFMHAKEPQGSAK